ncbi:MAG: alpha/beta family hydrolase [Synechococcaceae cyanobacterium]|nr:alpha/beta family hydrolase [Synechococcaceae cyanobacterium]
MDGPADADITVLLAHGAGAPMDSPFMAAIATGLAARGWRVVRFEFPYMAQQRLTGQRRAPDRLCTLLAAYREQLALEANRTLVIGGKSLGGRVASLLAVELDDDFDLRGCLCLGYPFHPPGKPQQLRTDHLGQLPIPTLILQGERDPFGNRAEVEDYGLGQGVAIQWLKAGDHSFKPSRSSGLTEADNWAIAVELADDWLRGLPVELPSVDRPGE